MSTDVKPISSPMPLTTQQMTCQTNLKKQRYACQASCIENILVSSMYKLTVLEQQHSSWTEIELVYQTMRVNLFIC